MLEELSLTDAIQKAEELLAAAIPFRTGSVPTGVFASAAAEIIPRMKAEIRRLTELLQGASADAAPQAKKEEYP